MNAVMPSSWPAASCCQSSQPTLIVVSAAPSSSLTWLRRAVEHDRALVAAEVDLHALARDPGLPLCIRATSSCLVIGCLSFVGSG